MIIDYMINYDMLNYFSDSSFLPGLNFIFSTFKRIRANVCKMETAHLNYLFVFFIDPSHTLLLKYIDL